MSDYTELISAVSEDMHSEVTDTEEAIIVNTDSRTFSLGESFNKIIGVTGDHNSEAVSFSIDKYIDSHDIEGCAEHKLYWENKEAETSGEATLKIKPQSQDKLILEWLVEGAVTEHAGEISFSLEITDYDVDGKLLYRWQATDGEGLIIKQGRQRKENYPEPIEESFVSLIDQATGSTYRVYVEDGKLMLLQSEV